LAFSAPVIVTVAEPLVAFPTPPISISQIVRNRLSNVRFSVSPLPNVAFISPPNAEYCEVKLVEFSQLDDCEVLGGEKSVVG
jgi:hypothetical protein